MFLSVVQFCDNFFLSDLTSYPLHTGKDIFNLDKIFFPINVGGSHWICAVAFMQEKRIQMYDSFYGSGHDYLRHILQYLKDEHLDKKKSPLPNPEEWVLVPTQPDTPKQANCEYIHPVWWDCCSTSISFS